MKLQKEYLTHLFYVLSKAIWHPSGLRKLKQDNDFKFEDLFGWFGGYQPKQTANYLTGYYIRDQKNRSNCSFQAWANTLSVVLGFKVSARWLTSKAYQQRLCGVNGWADLRAGGKVAQKWGCVSEDDCPSDESISWLSYISIDFSKLDKIAEQNKIQSYWSINSVDAYLKAIDEGYPVVIGRNWLSSMNQGGGFKVPWIIRRIGYFISGHGTMGGGYNTYYQGERVSREANSYSELWGDKGHFYCPLSDLANDISRFGAFAPLPFQYSKVTAKDIIEKYEGKNVRGNKDGTIYRIMAGAKAYFANDIAFLKINNFPYSAKNAFIVVPQEAIDAVPYYGGTREKSRLTGDGQGITPWDFIKRPVNNNFTEDMDADKLTKNAIIIGEEE